VIDGDLLNAEPLAQMKPGGQSVVLIRMTPAFHQAGTGEFETQKARRHKPRPLSRAATASASGSPNKSAARAEASTTLTTITVRADHGDGLAKRPQTQPPDLGQDVRRRHRLLLKHGGFGDRQKFVLQQPMMALSPLAQPLHDTSSRMTR
jgi:hypothetical protein